jgi:hypothetical protein
LGGLYIFKNSKFYKEHFESFKNLKLSSVDWLKGKPKWYLAENIKLNKNIKKYLKLNKLLYFDSDLDLLEYYKKNNKK